jgi:hypothetical protein
MSLRTVIGLLILVAALGVGAVVIRTEFISPATPISTSRPPGSPSNMTALHEQQRAEQKSEQEAIKANCAALRKMGAINKNCPPN